MIWTADKRDGRIMERQEGMDGNAQDGGLGKQNVAVVNRWDNIIENSRTGRYIPKLERFPLTPIVEK